MGLSNGARGPFVRKLSIPERDLVFAVTRAEDIKEALKGATWTSIQVNQASSNWHCDEGNIGASAIMAFGDYTGGDFEYKDRKVDIRDSILIIDGAKPHRSGAYEGGRTSLVLFTHASWPRMKPLDAAYLSMLGVPWRSPLSGSVLPDVLVDARAGLSFKVLYLFAGAARKASIKEELQRICSQKEVHLEMDEVDILQAASQDLTDETYWGKLLEKLKN